MEKEIQVVEYDPQWAKQYKEEAGKLKKILSDNYAGAYHIGSTVIKGAKAQPIIDVLAVLKKGALAEDKIAQLKAAGYEDKGEQGVPGRRFFVKEEKDRNVHVHMFGENNAKDIARFYAVSSYLASHEADRKEYETLKMELAEKYGTTPDLYEEEKIKYINSLEEKALEWQLKQNKLGSYMAMGMSLGLASGCAIGYIFGFMLWGMVLGTMAGLVMGMLVGRQKAGK